MKISLAEVSAANINRLKSIREANQDIFYEDSVAAFLTDRLVPTFINTCD